MNFTYTKSGIPSRAVALIKEFAIEIIVTVAVAAAALLVSGCGHYRVAGTFEYATDGLDTGVAPVEPVSATPVAAKASEAQ